MTNHYISGINVGLPYVLAYGQIMSMNLNRTIQEVTVRAYHPETYPRSPFGFVLADIS